MSMSYFVCTDNDSDTVTTFPDGLTYFFEQYGGYGEESEVAQVSSILNIDLSVFQQYNVPESEEIIWHEITELKKILDLFINKIKSTPSFFENVKHGNDRGQFQDEFMKLAQTKDTDKVVELIKQMQNKSNANFPPDHGYLKEGRLQKDLIELEKILTDLETSGSKRIKFLYM